MSLETVHDHNDTQVLSASNFVSNKIILRKKNYFTGSNDITSAKASSVYYKVRSIRMLNTIIYVSCSLQSPTYPAINALLAQWVPANERSLIGAFVYSGLYVYTPNDETSHLP